MEQLANDTVFGTGRYLFIVFTSSAATASVDSGFMLYLGFGASTVAANASAQLVMSTHCGAVVSILSYNSVALVPPGKQYVGSEGDCRVFPATPGLLDYAAGQVRPIAPPPSMACPVYFP